MKKAKRKKSKIKKTKKRVKTARARSQVNDLIHRTRIRVIGVGGGGGSIISEIASAVPRVEFVAANTDYQALKQASKHVRALAFGQKLTGGLGCGMDAKLGQKAAREDKEKISKLFEGIDLCVLVSCLGGGTGSGAAPEFAKIAKEAGTIVLGIFTTPFKFEGSKRGYISRGSLERITPNLNAISIIPNENIFKIIDKKTPIKQAFSAINQRLAQNLRGLIEMIYVPGLINIDFADLKTILEGRGKLAYLNSAEGRGANRAEEAVKNLLQNPLNEYNVRGAEKILFNITASPGVGMKEVEQISENIADANHRAKIIFGVSQDKHYKDKVKITLLAIGCGREEKPKPKSKPKPKKVVLESRPKPKKRRKPRPKPRPAKRSPKPKPKSRPRSKPKSKARPKHRPRPRPKRRPKPRLRPKRKKLKAKSKPNPKKKRKKQFFKKVIESVTAPAEEAPPKLVRRSALDVVKEVKKAEEEMLEKEKKWDIPAFLRRRPQGNK